MASQPNGPLVDNSAGRSEYKNRLWMFSPYDQMIMHCDDPDRMRGYSGAFSRDYRCAPHCCRRRCVCIPSDQDVAMKTTRINFSSPRSLLSTPADRDIWESSGAGLCNAPGVQHEGLPSEMPATAALNVFTKVASFSEWFFTLQKYLESYKQEPISIAKPADWFDFDEYNRIQLPTVSLLRQPSMHA